MNRQRNPFMGGAGRFAQPGLAPEGSHGDYSSMSPFTKGPTFSPEEEAVSEEPLDISKPVEEFKGMNLTKKTIRPTAKKNK